MAAVHVKAPTRQPEPRNSHLADFACVDPGDEIPVEAGYVRGHGTIVEDGRLVATVAGIVERVNKLVAVRPLRSRYSPEIGDVVIGRIKEVAQKQWKVDINGRREASLMLSAVNLPGGVQRRRTYEDELNMRSFFTESDLISAEIQEDGSVALHTRSLKYGLLEAGEFISVVPALIKRSPKRFHVLPCGVHVILGNNGYIFIHIPGLDGGHHESSPATESDLSMGVSRERICRVRNAICILDKLFISIHTQTIMDVYGLSEELDIPPKDMLDPEVAQTVSERARSRSEGA